MLYRGRTSDEIGKKRQNLHTVCQFGYICFYTYLYNTFLMARTILKKKCGKFKIIKATELIFFIYFFLNFTEIYTFISGSLNFLIHLIKIYLGVNNNILKQDIFVFKNAASLFSFFFLQIDLNILVWHRYILYGNGL